MNSSEDQGRTAADAGGPGVPPPPVMAPGGLDDVLSKIRVDVLDGRIAHIVSHSPSTTDFTDSFNNGGTWRNTFADGGQFLSNFNNLYAGQASLRHPAVQAALRQLAEALNSAQGQAAPKKS